MPNDVASMLGVPELDAPPPQPAPTAAPAQPTAETSGLAINNPLNLRPMPGGQWQGQTGVSPGGFATFGDIGSGWNAAEQNLQAKVTKHGLTTIQGIIGDPTNGWAPPSDHNDPAAYAAKVATALGVKPTDDISQRLTTDADFRHQMLSAMAAVETGKQVVFGGSASPQLADALGLTAQERAALQTGPQPASPEADVPGSKAEFNFGPQMGAMSQAAVARFHALANDPNRGIDPNASAGSPKLPYYVTPGTPVPQTAGIHWVDANGQEHVNPGGALENAGAAIQGAFQGLPVDLGSSLTRMTGGAFGVGTPQAALAADAAEQRRYAIEHLGDPYAQAGRFAGQALLGTGAALAVPELEAPAALGSVGRVAATGLTNALRGVVATAPSVGANPQPVAQQLATGALTGVVAPAITGAVGKAAGAVTGIGRQVAPDVAALADTAQSKYGIKLASGQVMGANGDRGAATAYSTMLGNNADVRAANSVQRQQWQKGVTGTYGDPTGNISPEALSASRARIGGVMNDVASRSSISPQAADATQTRIGQIISDAQKVLPDNEVKPLLNMAQSIGDVRGPQGISGESYQALTRQDAPLDRLESSDNSNVAHYASQIHDALNDGLAASSSPEDIETLRNARFQYKNLMTVAKAARNQNNIGIDGVLTPNSLNTATTSNFKGRAFQGAGDLDELNAIRNKFMTEPPNSFTSNRAADLIGPFKTGLEAAGATGLIGTLLNRPETALAAGSSALAGYGAKAAAQAIKQNKVAGSAANIVARSLPNAPGTVNALSGLRNVSKAIEVPLSALVGVQGVGALQPAGAQ